MIAWALPRHSLKTRILLVTVVLFVAGIWTLSLFASRVLRDDIATLLGEQQRTTVAYVAAEIDKEIVDALDIHFADRVEQVLALALETPKKAAPKAHERAPRAKAKALAGTAAGV